MKCCKPFFLTSALLILSMTSCSKEARMRIHADWTKDPKEMNDYGDFLIRNRPHNFYKDYDEGRKYIEKAAEKGHLEAMRNLGSLYAPGYLPGDQQKSIYWYNRAAEAGDRNAMSELGKAYRYGLLGLPIDLAKADHWSKRFEEQGIKDEDQRWAPLKSKAEKGDVKAMEGLAHAYEVRGEPYWKAAVLWYTQAGDAGSREACMRMVQAHREGQLGLPRDETKCDQWFRKWQALSAKP
jgi:uncharacterized protein